MASSRINSLKINWAMNYFCNFLAYEFFPATDSMWNENQEVKESAKLSPEEVFFFYLKKYFFYLKKYGLQFLQSW